MNVKRSDLRSRVSAASSAAPSLGDRLMAAQLGASDHPTAPVAPAGPAAVVPASLAGLKWRFVPNVPLDQIDPNPFPARAVYLPERVHKLASSIAANGQEQPGLATIRNGRYVLGDGETRRRSLKLLSDKPMNLMVCDGLTDRQLYELGYRANAEREGQTTFDNAMSWRKLLDDGIYASETELAEATGMSLPNVNKILGVQRLSKDMLALVAADPSVFSMSVLYELVLFEEVAGTESTIAIARQVADGNMSRKQIQDARQQHALAKPRKPKETSRQYKLEGQGLQSGVLKEWDSGKLSLELKVMDPEHRAKLVEKLREVIADASN